MYLCTLFRLHTCVLVRRIKEAHISSGNTSALPLQVMRLAFGAYSISSNRKELALSNSLERLDLFIRFEYKKSHDNIVTSMLPFGFSIEARRHRQDMNAV